MKVLSQTKHHIQFTQQEVLEILTAHLAQQGLIDDNSQILKHTIPESITVETIHAISEIITTENQPSDVTPPASPVDLHQHVFDTVKNVSSTAGSSTKEEGIQDIVVPGHTLKGLVRESTQSQLDQFNSSDGCKGNRITKDLFGDG